VRKPERKKPHEQPRRKSDDNIVKGFEQMAVRIWIGFVWLK
jgi:hypothetical protein